MSLRTFYFLKQRRRRRVRGSMIIAHISKVHEVVESVHLDKRKRRRCQINPEGPTGLDVPGIAASPSESIFMATINQRKKQIGGQE
jgi:hypothetical protein